MEDQLTAAGRRAYAEAVAVLQSVGESEDAAAEPLRRYGRLVSDLDRAERRWREAKREMLSIGSTGQAVPSPWLTVLGQLRREVGQLESELGLTPAARASLARRRGGQGSRGIGRAPDRQQRPRGVPVLLPTQRAS